MAAETALRHAVRLVATSLTHYAKAKGWHDDDYEIYFTTSPEWGRIRFVFVAIEFDDRDNYECYHDVWTFLEKDLGHEPDVLRALNMVVMGKKQVQEGGLFRIGSEYEDYKEYWTLYGSR